MILRKDKNNSLLKPQLLWVAVFFFFFVHAQEPPRFFGGVEAYRNVAFNTNFHYNLNIGSELFSWEIFAPEASINWFTGTIDNSSSFNSQEGFTESFVRKSYNAFVIAFSPKIVFEGESFKIMLAPTYNFGRNHASGSLFETADGGFTFRRTEREKVNLNLSFWSYSAGVEMPITDNNKLNLAVYLIYTNLNAGDAFGSISLPDSNVNLNSENTQSLGIAFRMYYNPFSNN